MACFPSGWRFVPTDQELINDYLFLKNHPNSAVTESYFSLPEFDMYEVDPWIVWEKRPYLKQDDFFCFTHLKKANSGGRINRRVGRSGTWSQGPNPKPIFDDDVDDNTKSLKRKCDDHHLSHPTDQNVFVCDQPQVSRQLNVSLEDFSLPRLPNLSMDELDNFINSQDFNSFLKNSQLDIFSAIDDILLPGD